MNLELASVAFHHENGAERAYADARERARGESWLDEVAFVEVHRHGRIVIRGTFAGHYLDIDGEGDVTGHGAATGMVAGAVVGLALGPVGLAVGLAGGAMAGGLVDASHGPEESGALFDDIRADVPKGSSAIVLFAAPAHVDAMARAFEGTGAKVVRHSLSEAQVEALRRAVADAPPAATA